VIAAIMQPYFFPYIGYFQLMRAVDVFILYDDAKHIEHGWVNRNRILIQDKPVWVTMPVKREDHMLPINRRSYLLADGVEPIKRKLRAAYPKRNMVSEFQVINELLDFADTNVARFNANLLQKLARWLGLDCEFMLSSHIAGIGHLKGQARVIELCRRTGVTRYINPIGGAALYEEASFNAAGVDLQFLQTEVEPIQLVAERTHLSIIHTLMNVGFAGVAAKLREYTLLNAAASSQAKS
jgi:hypothetical protein